MTVNFNFQLTHFFVNWPEQKNENMLLLAVISEKSKI